MKTIGIIGGIGPESTIEYYRQIIALYRLRKDPGGYPPILINSINLTRMLDLIDTRRLAEVTGYLAGEVTKLAQAGADLGLLAAVTPHIVFEDIQRQSPIPLVSIVEATRQAVQVLGLKKVGLFGTRFTMQASFFPQVFDRAGIAIIVPDLDDQAYIHDKYMSELVKGVFLAETRERLLVIAARLVARKGIEGLILGGTELPLILRGEADQKIPFLDTTAIHVEQVVVQMLSEEAV